MIQNLSNEQQHDFLLNQYAMQKQEWFKVLYNAQDFQDLQAPNVKLNNYLKVDHLVKLIDNIPHLALHTFKQD